jgi:flagellin
MADITISSRVRSNLLALQNTSDLMSLTQNRLATGKKVQSALDNPTSFFQASGLSERSNKLTSLLDGVNNGISTIQAASKGLDSIYKQLQALKGLISSVQAAGTGANQVTGTVANLTTTTAKTFASGDTLTLTDSVNNSVTTIDFASIATGTVQNAIDAVKTQSGGAYQASLDSNGKLVISNTAGHDFGSAAAGNTATLLGVGTATSAFSGGNITASQSTSYIKQFNDVLSSIDQFAQDASFNGVNLLQASGTLTINYNESGSSSSTVNGQAASASSLGLSQLTAGSNTANISSIVNSSATIDSAMASVKSMQASFSTTLSIAQNRQDFTKSLANILQTGSDNLTNADMNGESANLLALQTRQQLSQTALSLSNQADQAVLRLFG